MQVLRFAAANNQESSRIMGPEDIKIYAINSTTLGVTTFANIEMTLKIILLLVTIGYTIHKWIEMKNKEQ